MLAFRVNTSFQNNFRDIYYQIRSYNINNNSQNFNNKCYKLVIQQNTLDKQQVRFRCKRYTSKL